MAVLHVSEPFLSQVILSALFSDYDKLLGRFHMPRSSRLFFALLLYVTMGKTHPEVCERVMSRLLLTLE